jgi:uncharacterized protein
MVERPDSPFQPRHRSRTIQQLPLFPRELLPQGGMRPGQRRLISIVRLNDNIDTILRRLPQLSIASCWLAAGCIAQTFWNLKANREPAAGIDDYDLIYFDRDTSWEAEDRVIRETRSLFADLPIRIEIRNQARVPCWYLEKFGIAFPRVRSAHTAVRYYPSRTTAVAISVDCDGRVRCFAPFGLADLQDGLIRPNPKLDIPAVYREKASRWVTEWPALGVHPWHEDRA